MTFITLFFTCTIHMDFNLSLLLLLSRESFLRYSEKLFSRIVGGDCIKLFFLDCYVFFMNVYLHFCFHVEGSAAIWSVLHGLPSSSPRMTGYDGPGDDRLVRI
ncbi:hypothetical protein ABFS83_13G039400 [Erythranthe nasuta]